MSTAMKKDHAAQAKEAAGQAFDKTKEAAGQVGEAAQQVAQAVGQKAEDATAAVGQGIQHAAEGVREYGPHQGMLGGATQTVADTLASTGKYLEDKNLSGMVNDVTGLIRRNPIPAVLIGLGVGFLIGRALSMVPTGSNRSW
jgi:ElaB/YqjD/DUF883 family membrane-anchored ribosome-binding protein